MIIIIIMAIHPSASSSLSWLSLLSCLPHLLFAEFRFVSCLSNATFVAPTTLRLALSAWLSIYLSACLSVCLSSCLSACMSYCLPVSPTVCSSVWLSSCLCVFQFRHWKFVDSVAKNVVAFCVWLLHLLSDDIVENYSCCNMSYIQMRLCTLHTKHSSKREQFVRRSRTIWMALECSNALWVVWENVN